MSLQKLLSTPRGVLQKTVFSIKKRSGDMATINHVIGAPPSVRISFTEKMIMGVLLNVAMWGIPAWVIYHMPEYQKIERNKYIGP